MIRKIQSQIKDDKGIGGHVFTVVFVMLMSMLCLFIVTVFTIYINQNRLISEIEQNLNNIAADSLPDNLSSLRDTTTIDYDVLKDIFTENFKSAMVFATDEYEITDWEIDIPDEVEDFDAIDFVFTGHITIKMEFLRNVYEVFNRDIVILGRHQLKAGSLPNEAPIEDSTVIITGPDVEEATMETPIVFDNDHR